MQSLQAPVPSENFPVPQGVQEKMLDGLYANPGAQPALHFPVIALQPAISQ